MAIRGAFSAGASRYKRPMPKLAGQSSLNVRQDAVTSTLGTRPAVPKRLRGFSGARRKAALSMMRGNV